MNKLQRDGVNIANENLNTRLKYFICDTPARSFLKNTLGHGGKFSCEKCEVEGNKVSNRMVYKLVINWSQHAHHNSGPSPLLRILGLKIKLLVSFWILYTFVAFVS